MRTRCALMAPLCRKARLSVHHRARGALRLYRLKWCRGGAGMCIILPRRDEQMQVRLLPRSSERWRIMKGIGDGQPGPGDGLHEVPRECQVLSVREFVRQRDLPLFKGDPVRPLVPFCRTKVGVRIPSAQAGRLRERSYTRSSRSSRAT